MSTTLVPFQELAGKLLEVSTAFLHQDPRRLPEGNWFQGGTFSFAGGKLKSYTPIHVYLKDVNLRLYFWYDRDFVKWFKSYAVLTGDIEGERLEVYEMYSEKRVKDLNKHEQGNGDLGDRIVAGGYTYTLGNRKFHFVKRFVDVKVEVKWSKGGI